MQLRRFTADNTPAALSAVRLALGDDAIILANRKVGDQVEIIATGQMDDMDAMAESSVDGMPVALANRAEQAQQANASGPLSAVHGQHGGPVLINGLHPRHGYYRQNPICLDNCGRCVRYDALGVSSTKGQSRCLPITRFQFQI